MTSKYTFSRIISCKQFRTVSRNKNGTFSSIEQGPTGTSFRNFSSESKVELKKESKPFKVEDANPKDIEFLQVLLSRFAPEAERAVTYRSKEEPHRLRLGDIPATTTFMESFVSEKLPKDPIYDTASWLANNYSQFDTQPKSPHYHWTSWMRDNLSLDMQRLYAAFAEYMSNEKYRQSIVRQSSYELSRLWEWQNRRVAAGLSPDFTPEELQSIRIAAAAEAKRIEREKLESEQAAAAAAVKSSRPVEEDVIPADEEVAVAPVDPENEDVYAKAERLYREKMQQEKALKQGSSSSAAAAAAPSVEDTRQFEEMVSDELAAWRMRHEQMVGRNSNQYNNLRRAPRTYSEAVVALSSNFEDRIKAGEDSLLKANVVHSVLKTELEERRIIAAESAALGLEAGDILAPAAAHVPSLQAHFAPPPSKAQAARDAAAKQAEALRIVNVLDDSLAKSKDPEAQASLRRQLEAFRAQIEAGDAEFWSSTTLMNVQAQLDHLVKRDAELRQYVREVKKEDDRILEAELNDHGYVFDITQRPPCPTLDLLTEYLTVRYQDVIAQRDFVTHVLSRMSAIEGRGAGEREKGRKGERERGPAQRRLSPQEIREVNGELSRLFDEDLDAYVATAQRLASEDIIAPSDLAVCLQAARNKARITPLVDLAASKGKKTDSSAGNNTTTVDREALALVLQGKKDVATLTAAAIAAAASAANGGARSVWDEALVSGKYNAWAAKMKAWAEKDILARRERGQVISPQNEAKLLAIWDKPLSYDAASTLWVQYTEAAGAVAPPTLAEVITADRVLLSHPTSSSSSASNTTTTVEEKEGEKEGADVSTAIKVKEAVKKLYLQYAARQGSTNGVVTLDGTPLSVMDLTQANAEVDVSSPAALADAFKPVDMGELLACHWEAVSRTFMNDTVGWKGPPATWEDMYQLMLETAKEFESPSINDNNSHNNNNLNHLNHMGAGAGAGAAQEDMVKGMDSPALKILCRRSEDIDAAELSAVLAAPSSANETENSIRQQQHVAALREANPDATATWLGTTEADATVGAATARPPYVGAKPILRWTQTIILHAASAFGGHPRNAPVQLEVRIPELQAELGLSAEAAALLRRLAAVDDQRREVEKASEKPMKQIALAERRFVKERKASIPVCSYDKELDVIRISTGMYNERESNRKLALEQLHAMIKTAEAKFPNEDEQARSTHARSYLQNFGMRI
eukprot:CAMPEP_0175068698 /NCGR_PEP_ID=MMETSP0052_2-20121109/17810_1 /TAXON_ID=51329 ORGANISM="Polytomella parva, Strain SAG 63-3" /NCGR_SAMPLE_ID=MMETSP0052_2 /ASSEMBLY_ACC=CAM_ASM_000194 /LENGTH=1205 /DNA_ID=CAMNT_0016335743 /DNA_START=56 /DNA_END=3673 /DNA_ORIENTATION=-